MRTHCIARVFLLFGSLWSAGAYAASDYSCTIEKRISAMPETEQARKIQEKAFIGKQFTVERETGIMAGALQNAFTNDPEIIDDGAEGRDYKVVSTLKSDEGHLYGSNIYALTISGNGKSSGQPFAFMENLLVYLGQCESIKRSR